MKKFTIILCILAFPTLASSLNLKHNAEFKVDNLPGHDNLLTQNNLSGYI